MEGKVGHMYKRILVPYDLSESSRHALKEALDLVSDVPDAEVTVLRVVEWSDYNVETFRIASRMAGVSGSSFNAGTSAEVNEEVAKEAIDEIASSISNIVGNSKCVNIVVINGSPNDSIASYAENKDYDCIVMGHRGLGAVRGVLGSVCYSVLHKTSKPVLVVK